MFCAMELVATCIRMFGHIYLWPNNSPAAHWSIVKIILIMWIIIVRIDVITVLISNWIIMFHCYCYIWCLIYLTDPKCLQGRIVHNGHMLAQAPTWHFHPSRILLSQTLSHSQVRLDCANVQNSINKGIPTYMSDDSTVACSSFENSSISCTYF